MGGQAFVQVGAGVEVVQRAAVGQGLIELLHGRLTQAIQRFLAQAGDQHAMLARQATHGGEQVLIVLIAQVGHQHHQRATPLTRQQQIGSGAEVGRLLAGVEVVNGIEQHVQLRRAFDRRQITRLVASEGRQPHRIALAQRDVAEQQAGVEGMVEVRQLVVLAAHAPAAVEQEDYLLVAFVLVLAGDGGALAGSGLPVDLAQGVAITKLA